MMAEFQKAQNFPNSCSMCTDNCSLTFGPEFSCLLPTDQGRLCEVWKRRQAAESGESLQTVSTVSSETWRRSEIHCKLVPNALPLLNLA